MTVSGRKLFIIASGAYAEEGVGGDAVGIGLPAR